MEHFYERHSGTCSSSVEFDLEEGVLHNVVFHGGCDGNLKAVAKLVEGKKAEDMIPLLSGIDCHGRGTSCADQFAKALTRVLRK